MSRILVLLILLILYGSLYPWDFRFHPLAESPLRILLRAWPRSIDRWEARDIVVNILLYVPLGAAAALALAQKAGALARRLLPLLLGLSLSTAIELLQIFDRGRTASACDIACNFAGTAAGVWLAAAFSPQIHALLERRRSEWRSAPGAFLLLILWAAGQVYPFFPALGRYAFLAKLRALLHSPPGATELLGAAAGWLTVAMLSEALFGRDRAPRFFILLLLLLPARLLIAGNGLRLADLAGAAAAAGLWRLLPREPSARYRTMAVFLVASLAVRGFAPFHLVREHARFNWIPFANLLEWDWLRGGVILFRKAFDYGSAVWMVEAAGAGYVTAAALVATVLGAIEVVQLRLPGRSPEITDPILAVLLAWVLWLLERDRPARKNSAGFR